MLTVGRTSILALRRPTSPPEFGPALGGIPFPPWDAASLFWERSRCGTVTSVPPQAGFCAAHPRIGRHDRCSVRGAPSVEACPRHSSPIPAPGCPPLRRRRSEGMPRPARRRARPGADRVGVAARVAGGGVGQAAAMARVPGADLPAGRATPASAEGRSRQAWVPLRVDAPARTAVAGPRERPDVLGEAAQRGSGMQPRDRRSAPPVARMPVERHPSLAPFAAYLDDPDVTDLFVNGADGLFVDRGAGVVPAPRMACHRTRGA